MGQTDSKNTVSEFWLVCGLPRAGKTTIQQKLAIEYFTRGVQVLDWVPKDVRPPQSILNAFQQTIYDTRNDNGFIFIDLFPPES